MPPKAHRRSSSSVNIPKAKKAPPPPTPRSGGGAAGGEDEQREEPLQAIVLTDSFEPRFRPFTLETPRCLVPLANTPLLAYTLRFLAAGGVDEVILCVVDEHAATIEDWMIAEGWMNPSSSSSGTSSQPHSPSHSRSRSRSRPYSHSPFSKVEIFRRSATSVGEMMRDVDQKGLVKGDFLVVHGDVVSNFPIREAIAAHRERRVKDKNAIMTMVLREAGEGFHRLKPASSGVGKPVFIIDLKQQRCLQYAELKGGPKARVRIDPELIKKHKEIEIRSDLIDAGIDVCTPDALALWTDSFDYQEPRREYLVGVLRDYELNGKTIHTHIIGGKHYAGRAHSLQAYNAISKDVVQRWTFPYCPDSNFGRDERVTLLRGLFYKERDVILARSAVVQNGCVIGKGTSIGEGSVVTNSIIGKGCQIGRNVKLDGAYIWDHVVVGDGADVGEAIIASEAVIGNKCVVKSGALISFAVRIADGFQIPGNARLVRSNGRPTDPNLVGKGGDGVEFVEEDDGDEDELLDLFRASTLSYNAAYNSSNESVSTFASEDDDDDEMELNPKRSSRGSFTTIMSDDGVMTGGHGDTLSLDDAIGGTSAASNNDFYYDAATSIYDSLQKGDSAEVVQLELVGLRMSNNASENQVRRAIAASFMKRISTLVETGEKSVKDAVADVFTRYQQLVKRSIFDYNATSSSKRPDQANFLLAMQRELASRPKGGDILLFSSQKLYELDLIEEEGFEEWWTAEESLKREEGNKMEVVRLPTAKFMEWLREAEEESDSDDD